MKTKIDTLKTLLGCVVVSGLLLQPALSRADGENKSQPQSQNSDGKSSDNGNSGDAQKSSDSQKSGDSAQSGDSQKSGDSSKTETQHASVASPIKSKADPFGLPVANLVQTAGSDAAAAEFLSYLPDIQKQVSKNLPETVYLKNAAAMALDPSKLTVLTDSTARIYFVSEGAGYHNTLGLNILPPGSALPTSKTPEIIKGDSKLIFPDASSPVSSYDPAKTIIRTGSEPLLPGDFVNLGNVKAGSLLDFYLISNGANGGTAVFTDEAARNPDKIQHIVTLSSTNSPYLLLSFEDMYGGGDHDYNDTVFAIDLRSVKLQKLVSAPEPSTWLIMAGFGGILLIQGRRRNRNA